MVGATSGMLEDAAAAAAAAVSGRANLTQSRGLGGGKGARGVLVLVVLPRLVRAMGLPGPAPLTVLWEGTWGHMWGVVFTVCAACDQQREVPWVERPGKVQEKYSTKRW